MQISASAQSISVTAHLSHSMSRLSKIWRLPVRFGLFNQHLSGYFDASDRTSGTALDGTYQINVSVRMFDG